MRALNFTLATICGLLLISPAMAATIAISSPATAWQTPTPKPTITPTPKPTPAPDNTAQNKKAGATADKQSQTKPDLALLQKIRQAIIADKTLSMTAHNCKVITQNGSVILRGPVNTLKEKDTIGAIAVKLAGADKVTNDLLVKTN